MMNLYYVGVDYCVRHHGIRNEDEHHCDWRDESEDVCVTCDGDDSDCPTCGGDGIPPCDLRELLWIEEETR